MVACRFNNRPRAATVLISAKKRREKKIKAETRKNNMVQIAPKSEKNGNHKIEALKVIKEEAQINAERGHQKTCRKPEEPYQGFLSFLETGEISFFKNKITNSPYQSD